ncbi:MAG: DUF4239 domain-containing protein [Chloroflexi bacterium]|nr:DUF4239 domain-containing protein [Chloroflexota bacterium]
MSTWLQGALIIGGSLVLALAGFALVHRYVPLHIREPQNEVAGFIYAVLGVMYAILLAYVTIVVWQQFDDTSSLVDQEAIDLANIYHGVDQFPDPGKGRVHDTIRNYVETTIDEEWPLLGRGETSPRSDELAHDLQMALTELPISTESDQVLADHALTAYHDFSTARQLRIFQSSVGVHPLLWVMLIGGAIITIGFTYLFGVSNARAHAAMIAALTLVIAGTLFMIEATNYPFSGDVHVPPDALHEVLQGFD